MMIGMGWKVCVGRSEKGGTFLLEMRVIDGRMRMNVDVNDEKSTSNDFPADKRPGTLETLQPELAKHAAMSLLACL